MSTDPRFKDANVALLLPGELLDRFDLAPPSSFDGRGGVFRLTRREDHPRLRLEVWPDPSGSDPCYVLELKFSFLGIPEIVWIASNDLSKPRFFVDALGNLPLAPKSGLRNLGEEERAMRAGLAPNQVREGLHILRQSFEAVDRYCIAVGAGFATAFAMAYHNAVEYQRCGFTLRSGEELMAGIEAGFAPGGRLAARLDSSTPFRVPELGETVTGRSWAIHDGVMGDEWFAPELMRMVGQGSGGDAELREYG